MTKKKIAGVILVGLVTFLNILLLTALERDWISKLLLCVTVDGFAVIFLCNLETLLRIPLEIIKDRAMFLTLVRNDFQARFAGSYLGVIRAFVHPVILIGLYWFVFQFGLRSGSASSHPFILFLMSGLIPWFYFSEAWSGSSGALIEYNYLVKKVVFNVGFLPVIKVCSALFVHLFFVVIVVIMGLIYGYGIHLHLFQLAYYICCNMLLVLGLSYFTAAFTVFFRDMTQIISIVLTMGMWMTPIMWTMSPDVPELLHLVFKLNPMYYIVDGFRDSLLDKVWFWEKPLWSIYFWSFTIILYLVGVKLFNRLKIHFSDVL